GHVFAHHRWGDSVFYVPHDDQLEGVCKSLDGIHLFAITPTGSGKTGYYIIYMLVILAVVADPSLCPSVSFPSNPCLLVICPTIPLQLDMVSWTHVVAHWRCMKLLGLEVLPINSQTRSVSLRIKNEELWVTARKKLNIILTGPEQLSSVEFEKALGDKQFYAHICGMGFDKAWGVTFRKEFQQMGFVKARMDERHNPSILTSRWCPFDNICQLLGLNKNYHLIRHSSFRPDVWILFRELISLISGDSFPELDWVVEDKRPSSSMQNPFP
ncbi:hypothetical protein B0H10DRAFT_1833484, partial [Mycena sp. CBHHK59/15]